MRCIRRNLSGEIFPVSQGVKYSSLNREVFKMSNCAIVGINWGDEGKGRMVDLLTQKI